MTSPQTVQNHYQLLSVEPTASAEEIKRAFRAEIARYHPDKVQHLGPEFQEMAATRAAQLTEAYRTLMSPELRGQYDRLCAGAGAAVPPPPEPPRAAPNPPPAEPSEPPPAPAAPKPERFAKEHATRDEFVRRATLARLRAALSAECGSLSETPARDFDFNAAIKSRKLFGRGGDQRFAVRFTPHADAAALQDAWAAAQKAGGRICVLLVGNGLAPARELADAISAMKRKSRDGAGVCVVPVDIRDWTAHVPADAPPVCKTVVQRLRDRSA